jgi:hypothetical protein
MSRAIGTFEKGYRAIINQLFTASHGNPKAEGLAKLAIDGNLMIFLMSLKVHIINLHYLII